MRAQIQRLQKLTIDLLDLSRLDADVVEIQREPVDLKEVARDVADEFRPAARAHGSSLQVRGRGEVVALADLNRVSQIIRILIDNAITHTPQGTNVTVTAVRGTQCRRADRRATTPRRASTRGPSTRSSTASTRATRRPAPGSGLAIADELALRMDGRLAVVSRRGHTAFTLSLPASKPRRRQREPAGAAA